MGPDAHICLSPRNFVLCVLPRRFIHFCCSIAEEAPRSGETRPLRRQPLARGRPPQLGKRFKIQALQRLLDLEAEAVGTLRMTPRQCGNHSAWPTLQIKSPSRVVAEVLTMYATPQTMMHQAMCSLGVHLSCVLKQWTEKKIHIRWGQTM